jgi:diguanylate cyclase (GGDEF)-like protein
MPFSAACEAMPFHNKNILNFHVHAIALGRRIAKVPFNQLYMRVKLKTTTFLVLSGCVPAPGDSSPRGNILLEFADRISKGWAKHCLFDRSFPYSEFFLLMKRLIPAVAIILGWASAALAAPPAAPATLTSLRAVHALTNAEASHALPVAFEATVTYFPGYDHIMMVQDGDVAIFVLVTTNAKLVPGDRILVRGRTQESFRPIIIPDSVTLLRHGDLPKPASATFDELISGQYDSRLVTVRAVVRTASIRTYTNAHAIYLEMLTDGGYIDAVVDSDDENALKDLLDAEVEVTGVAGGKFDGKMQQTGVLLHILSLANVKILKRAGVSPWSIPLTPLNQILASYHVHDLSQRVRVRGTITHYQPGLAVVLQDGARSLWINTPMRTPLQIGDIADAIGFPEAHSGFLALTHGEIEDSHVQAPVTPQPATWSQLAIYGANKRDGYIYDLVSIEGQVVTEVREANRDEYILSSNGHLFTAIYRHMDWTSQIPLPPMKQIPIGATIRVSGICTPENFDLFNGQVPFDIMLRSFDDITVVGNPPLLNIRNLVILAGLLLAMVVIVGARGWSIERKGRRQTAALAYIEGRRSRILEDINGARPLAEIIEEITEMVSFNLKGAPCWCQIADGALLGNCPPELTAQRIVQKEIPAHSGPPLGMLFAGLDPLAKLHANESETLSRGAALATLAIETRRLYSDLLHRSEFDLLTDIHNRFSLDKHLDALIEEAREKAGIFGLIYIDLDDFKRVNDLYGHQAGDLYLQGVAERMKRQLRGDDTLARLGGDEFAALITVVRNRAGAEEIAHRLEHSFDEPFTIEGHVLRGSACVGVALYPQDGDTKDSLLSAADDAMYVAKNIKRQGGTAPDEQRNSKLTPEGRA